MTDLVALLHLAAEDDLRRRSFHISVTSVSPGNTLSAKRTLMLLKKRGSFFENALMTWRAA